jgi:hypothetical protein
MADNSWYRDASGRLTFEMFNISGESYTAICRDVAEALQLEQTGILITDFLSFLSQDYRRGPEVVGLEWDNWSGFMVVAKTPESEPLVEAVADWLLHSEWASFSKPTERGPDVDRASASDSH